LFEWWVEAALKLLAVTTLKSGVRTLASDECPGHPNTSNINCPVFKRKMNMLSVIKYNRTHGGVGLFLSLLHLPSASFLWLLKVRDTLED
jgi:hypothetical protein